MVQASRPIYFALLFVLVACGRSGHNKRTAASPPSIVDTCPADVEGKVSDLPVQLFERDNVQPLEQCWEQRALGPGGYVRVAGTGTRRLAVGHRNVPEKCWQADTFEKIADCQVVLVDHFGRAVLKRLRERFPQDGDRRFSGVGLGACSEMTRDQHYDAYNLSIFVNDWRDVEPAIAAIQALLNEWQIENHFGVSIQKPLCGTLLRAALPSNSPSGSVKSCI